MGVFLSVFKYLLAFPAFWLLSVSLRFPWLRLGRFLLVCFGRLPWPVSPGLFGCGSPWLVWSWPRLACLGLLPWLPSASVCGLLSASVCGLNRLGGAGLRTAKQGQGVGEAAARILAARRLGRRAVEGSEKRALFLARRHTTPRNIRVSPGQRYLTPSRTTCARPHLGPFSRFLAQSGLNMPVLSALVQFTATARPLAACPAGPEGGSNKLFRPAKPDHPTPPPEKAGGRL